MTAVGYPLNAVGGAPAYTGRALRAASLAPLLAGATAARPLGARSGVRPGTPSTTVTVASMTWSVAPHAGILDVEAAAEAGPYGYAITAAETGAVNAAHATYTRWDGIYVQLSDPSESDGTSTPGVAVVYVAGTPSASPAMPSQPARSLLLARIVVPQSGGGSPSVVWLAPPCGLADGVPWFATEADRDAAIPPAQRRPGIQAVIGQGAGLAEYIWDGTAWVRTWSAAGWQAFTPTIGGSGWAVGNGTLAGFLLADGPITYFWVRFTLGSTSTAGGGGLALGIGGSPTGMVATVEGVAVDTSAGVRRPLTALPSTGSSQANPILPDGSQPTTNNPWTWAVGDVIEIRGWFRTA